MPILTGIDVLGVQRYVFSSNRLRDVVAASWIVHWATARDGLLARSGASDVLLASGGNALLHFDDLDHARDFAADYTRGIHDQAPGLEVVLAHREYGPGTLAEAIGKLRGDLARAKLERLPSVPQLGLSVTASCRISGIPAVGFDALDPSVPLSKAVLRWRDQETRGQANERWGAFLQDPERFDFPREIDDMGRTRGETSLLGVVHIDGNGVGRSIDAWLEHCRKEERGDDEVRDQLGTWSRALDEAARRGLETVVTRVTQAVDAQDRLTGAVPDLAFELCRRDGATLLPLRPVLLGGDDLTFLCDGRIALALAEIALDAFVTQIPDLGPLSACAGVALVPAHAPFERAYDLAEALCRNAKRQRREHGEDGGWIDWHVGAPRPGESVEALRARAYRHRAAAGTTLALTCRPYRLGTDPSQSESWRWLSETVLGTGDEGFRGPRWGRHHNKIKELASLVREGPEGVRRARRTWTAARIDLPGGLEATDGFFDATRTPLLDAVELLDIHLPLARDSR